MTSKRFAVVGDPIDHSLSPVIHLAAYKYLGLDWSYEKIRVASGELKGFIEESRHSFVGFSVTMPLKTEAADLATTSDPLVKQLGIANTLIYLDSGLAAFNTDVFGIRNSLASCWSSEPTSIAILGAGATARSALLAVSVERPTAQVTCFARDTGRTEEIKLLAAKLGISFSVTRLSDYQPNQNLTISTIPSDGLPAVAGAQTGWLLDANYANPDERFSESFDPSKIVTGKTMLLWQAIAQIRLFVSMDASRELPDETEVFQAMAGAL